MYGYKRGKGRKRKGVRDKGKGRKWQGNVYFFCLVPKRREKKERHFKFIHVYNMHVCLRNRKAIG
jgi:hypothetical protein